MRLALEWRIHLFKLATNPLFLNGDMSSSEDDEDRGDRPPSRPIPLTDSELDNDVDIAMDYIGHHHGSQILEIDHIAVPTLRKLKIRRQEYQSFPEESRVERCLREVTGEGGLWYKTVFADGHTDLVNCYKHHEGGGLR